MQAALDLIRPAALTKGPLHALAVRGFLTHDGLARLTRWAGRGSNGPATVVADIGCGGSTRRTLLGHLVGLLRVRGVGVDKAIIEHVVDAWIASRVDHVVVVVSPSGDDGQRLAKIARQAGADVVVPRVAPDQMKDSVQAALQHIAEKYSPLPNDAWLLAPADMPRLSIAVIDLLLDTYDPSRPATLASSRGVTSSRPVVRCNDESLRP